jgi:hypothetical protein
VTDAVSDPPSSLAVAEQKFSAFLPSQNYPTALFWVFPGNVIVDKERRCWIKSHRGAAREHAALSYEKGLKRNLGIGLRAICASDTETFATVFLPENDLDAQSNLMGSCLKLSCPIERCSAYMMKCRFRWLLLWLSNGRRSRSLWR